MTGTAFRTPTPPPDPGGNTEAIYAIYPMVIHSGREATAYVLVSSSPMVYDTVVHPCTREGYVLSLRLLACVAGLDHREALVAAGYELEEVARRVA